MDEKHDAAIASAGINLASWSLVTCKLTDTNAQEYTSSSKHFSLNFNWEQIAFPATIEYTYQEQDSLAPSPEAAADSTLDKPAGESPAVGKDSEQEKLAVGSPEAESPDAAMDPILEKP